MKALGAHFDHEDMVANILTTYGHATPLQVIAGRAWYGQAHDLAASIANVTGFDTRRIVLAIAALSPRNPWRWNVADAYAYALARAEGRLMPRANTFKRNQAAAWRALDRGTDAPWLTSAPKVRAFVDAIMGDDYSVVVDTWAARVATGGAIHRVANDHQYAAVARAYQAAAVRLAADGTLEFPRDLQAVTWLVAQSEGLATTTATRHTLTFKAGTPAFIVEALS